MISLYPIWSLKGIALSVVIATYIQAAYYIYYSGKALKVSVFELVPIKKLAILFIWYFSLFFIWNFLLKSLDMNGRLIVAFIFTCCLILIGMLFYLRSSSLKKFKS
jgi:hypothetical protein